MPIGLQIANRIDQGLYGSGQRVYHARTIAYMNAIAVPYDNTIYYPGTAYEITGKALWNSIDDYVLAIDSIWSKGLYFWGAVSGTTGRHRVNLFNPGVRDITNFIGGWTWTPAGPQGNGVNTYMRGGIVPSTVFTLNSSTIGFNLLTNVLAAEIDCGCQGNAGYPNRFAFSPYFSASGANSQHYLAPGINRANSNTIGDFLSTRTSSTDHRIFVDGVQLGTTDTTLNTQPLPTFYELYFGCFSNMNSPNNVSTKKRAWDYGLTGLTPAEALLFQTANNQLLASQFRNL